VYASGAHGGLEGGARPPLGGCRGAEPPMRRSRGSAPKKKKLCLEKRVMYLGGFFGTWFFADGFLFSVKELGFWTNPGHWVRVLDVVGSYMYIVL
jgi:hypothetical protein